MGDLECPNLRMPKQDFNINDGEISRIFYCKSRHDSNHDTNDWLSTDQSGQMFEKAMNYHRSIQLISESKSRFLQYRKIDCAEIGTGLSRIDGYDSQGFQMQVSTAALINDDRQSGCKEIQNLRRGFVTGSKVVRFDVHCSARQ